MAVKCSSQRETIFKYAIWYRRRKLQIAVIVALSIGKIKKLIFVPNGRKRHLFFRHSGFFKLYRVNFKHRFIHK